MHQPGLYRFFFALAATALVSTPLFAGTSSKPAPKASGRRTVVVDIAPSSGSGIVSGPVRETDSPLVRAAHYANLRRARYAAEGKESIALNKDRVISLGSVGMVQPVLTGSVIGSRSTATATSAPAPPRPAGALLVAPTSNVSSSVSMTTIGSSVTTTSPGSSVSTSNVPSTVVYAPASSVPTNSVGSSVTATPIVP